MATFQASKFDAATDTDRPVIGDSFEHQGNNYKTEKVSHLLMSDIMSGKEEPTEDGCDVVLIKDHATRPAVFWVMWGNKH